MSVNTNTNHYKRILVTTALEESWPEEGQVLFLGNWCQLYERKEKWLSMDFKVLPYHWDDRKKLYNDFIYLQKLNDGLLIELSEKLNGLHCVNKGVRYWRILIGYWLNLYTATIFDRWSMIKKAVETGNVSESIQLIIDHKNVVANDSKEFQNYIFSDYWNHYLYSWLLKEWTDTHLKTREYGGEPPNKKNELSTRKGPKKELVDYINSFLCKTGNRDKILLSQTYLPKPFIFFLQCYLKQIPKFWLFNSTLNTDIDPQLRTWRLEDRSNLDVFERVIRELLPQQIPKIFIEGYKLLNKKNERLSLPRQPKVIFTSGGHLNNILFKAWIAEKTEAGSKLLIGEHGGFGSGLFKGSNSYQLAIADTLLSWGWKDKKYPQVKPFGILKTVWKKQSWDPLGIGLMVEVAMPRYSYDIRSMLIAGQMIEYFEDQFTFYKTIPKKIQERILVRLYPRDYGWNQEGRWKDRFQNVQFDKGTLSYFKLIKKSRIIISTYNATTYLESLSLNVPTIMFWNPDFWEIKNSAKPYFNLLKDVGIFHENPISAAKKLSEIWNDIVDWWDDPLLQKARIKFCQHYARSRSDAVTTLKKIIFDMART